MSDENPDSEYLSGEKLLVTLKNYFWEHRTTHPRKDGEVKIGPFNE